MWDENKRCDTEDCFPDFCFLFLISFFTLSHTQNHTDIPLLACGSSVCRSKLSSQPSHSESNVRTSTRTLLAVSESFRKLYSNKYKEPSCGSSGLQIKIIIATESFTFNFWTRASLSFSSISSRNHFFWTRTSLSLSSLYRYSLNRIVFIIYHNSFRPVNF